MINMPEKKEQDSTEDQGVVNAESGKSDVSGPAADEKKPAAAAKKAKPKKAATSKTPKAKKPAESKAKASKAKAKASKIAGKSSEERSSERRTAREKRPDGYYYAVGRRKRAVAQVKLWLEHESLEVKVDGRDLKDYFPVSELQERVLSPLKAVGYDTAKVEVQIGGGGMHGQAEAVRLALSRALLKVNPDYRLTLKKLGFLTRDPREKERRKYGLRKARRAPQWSKR